MNQSVECGIRCSRCGGDHWKCQSALSTCDLPESVHQCPECIKLYLPPMWVYMNARIKSNSGQYKIKKINYGTSISDSSVDVLDENEKLMSFSMELIENRFSPLI